MIKVGLLGFGKTGREVARELLIEESVHLVCVFKYHDTYVAGKEVGHLLGMDSTGVKVSLCSDLKQVLMETEPDVLIDFAAKRSLMNYLDTIAECEVNLVICSTGYNDTQINRIKEKSKDFGIAWCPNITDGINMLSKLGRIVKESWPEADISIIETHHSMKKGISGTAMKLAENLRDSEDIKIGRAIDSARIENEIILHKVRLGGVIGRHEIIFGNPYQTITLTHNTISRRAFGRGAIRAAHWIDGKKGFYTMDNVIST
ncbi:MAG: 4-hydroxy-tetrahydrodipicolinate reductase [Spirochaetales bacterium]|nr:4-hydroxy-tetrahydrodipicolinate reductase [Spirochaetales bacterium]